MHFNARSLIARRCGGEPASRTAASTASPRTLELPFEVKFSGDVQAYQEQAWREAIARRIRRIRSGCALLRRWCPIVESPSSIQSLGGGRGVGRQANR